jgi:hypothetical protein
MITHAEAADQRDSGAATAAHGAQWKRPSGRITCGIRRAGASLYYAA